MKKIILITMILFGFFGIANEPSVDDILNKVQQLMLQKPQEAFKMAQETYQKKDLDHKQKLQSLFLMTNASNILQKPLDVLKYGNQALKMATEEEDLVTKIKILSIIGNTYQSLQLNEKARAFLNQAELFLSSPKIPDSLNLLKGNIFYLKGMNYFYSLDSGIAMSYFNKAVNQYLQSKNPLAEINLKLAYLNKGFAQLQQKQIKQAEESFKLASINKRETPGTYPPQFVELHDVFIELGKAKILSLENKPELSNNILFEIMNKRKGQPARDDLENDIYELLSKNYLQQQDISKHDHYESLYKKRVSESNRAAAVLTNQLILQEEENNKIEMQLIDKKYWSLIFVTSAFFLIIIAISFIKTIKKEKMKRILKHEVTKNL
ncbi:hypothetical protein [Epilithonimonas sp.]|uniref:hypothetical protein n=1 Tax=Epilithonimonas sp. TaxID=2894511 RepID=UPI002897819E|nr:hypothetical protein [Epilithonimonas sp.]